MMVPGAENRCVQRPGIAGPDEARRGAGLFHDRRRQPVFSPVGAIHKRNCLIVVTCQLHVEPQHRARVTGWLVWCPSRSFTTVALGDRDRHRLRSEARDAVAVKLFLGHNSATRARARRPAPAPSATVNAAK